MITIHASMIISLLGAATILIFDQDTGFEILVIGIAVGMNIIQLIERIIERRY